MRPPRTGGDPAMRVTPNDQEHFDPTLQAAFRLYEKFDPRDLIATQQSVRPQKWGDRDVLKNDVNAATGSTMPEKSFVDIGPFVTPLAIRLDYDVDPGVQSAYPTWIYRLVIGFGTTSIIKEFDELPRVVVAQSLQVYVRRRQSIIFNGEQFPMTLWATPHMPGMQPTPIGYTNVPMAIGTGSVDVNPPRMATHCMAEVTPGENNLISLRVLPPSGTVQQLTLHNNAQAPFILPIPPDMLTYQLTRGTTTAALTYTIFWLRC